MSKLTVKIFFMDCASSARRSGIMAEGRLPVRSEALCEGGAPPHAMASPSTLRIELGDPQQIRLTYQFPRTRLLSFL